MASSVMARTPSGMKLFIRLADGIVAQEPASGLVEVGDGVVDPAHDDDVVDLVDHLDQAGVGAAGLYLFGHVLQADDDAATVLVPDGHGLDQQVQRRGRRAAAISIWRETGRVARRVAGAQQVGDLGGERGIDEVGPVGDEPGSGSVRASVRWPRADQRGRPR